VKTDESSGFGVLLDGLAAGASVALFSADDWALRLGDSPLAQQFVAQLRREWHPAHAPDAFCQEMLDLAQADLMAQAPTWPHIWAHTLRVMGTAVAISAEAGIEPAHGFLLGLFHDLGKLEEINGGEDHEKIGAQLLQERLDGHYSPQIITLMVDAVAKQGSTNNPYVRVIHNADKLDKIGATGIARRLSTDWGVQHLSEALERVRSDLSRFPIMNFPTSARMVGIKKDFSRSFMTAADVVLNIKRSQLA
jgi:hypothetical protein